MPEIKTVKIDSPVRPCSVDEHEYTKLVEIPISRWWMPPWLLSKRPRVAILPACSNCGFILLEPVEPIKPNVSVLIACKQL